MIYLLLTILLSLGLTVIFKLFDKYGVNTLHAVVVNYITCVVTGSLALGYLPSPIEVSKEPWFIPACFLGVLFITGFYAVGLTIQRFGMAVSSVTQKMSLLISVPFGVIAYQVATGWGFWLAMVAAITAVLLTNWPDKGDDKKHTFLMYLLPLWVFVSSGMIEVALQHVQNGIMLPLGKKTDGNFTVALFAIPATLGSIFVMYQVLAGKAKLERKSILAGILLGVPNYGSIFFLMEALSVFDGAVALPVINVSIIMLSALVGLFFFHDKLSKLNWIGIGLALVSILLFAW